MDTDDAQILITKCLLNAPAFNIKNLHQYHQIISNSDGSDKIHRCLMQINY